MSVSLKKSEKVDLSKPVISRKLPECTPVHLIDEEETIKSCSARPNISNVAESETVHSNDTRKTLSDDASEYEAERRKEKVFHVVAWFSVGVLVIAVCVAVFLVAVNLPEIVEPSDEVFSLDVFFSTVTSALGYLFDSPIVMLLMCISLLSIVVRSLKNFMDR